jgi:dipeptidyl aminopeptidase/acylaminoacyl peptidase
MRRILLSLLVLAVALPALAQAKHPFTFDDMMKLKRVGDPQVSPDGKWVIFSVVNVDLEANTKTPHIWIVPTAGGDARQLMDGQDADRPRWSPDGKRFAFLSKKEEGSQIWTAGFDSASGKVIDWGRLTSITTEAGGEIWSPDGKSILFTSDVYPECDGAPAAEAACNAKKLKDAESSKVKALIFDHLLYRHWNAYKEGKRTHLFVLSLPVAEKSDDMYVLAKPASDPLDLTPGDYDAPVFSLGGQDDYTFSPDGQEICYASNHDKNPAASTNNDLWTVPANFNPAEFHSDVMPEQILAKTKNITADNPASDSSPLYSPDGRYIAYRAQQRPGYESDRFRLMLYDRKTGEKKNLTEPLDRWVNSFSWLPNSRGLLFTMEEEGQSPIAWILPFDFNQGISGPGTLRDPKKETILYLAKGFFDSPTAVNTDLVVANGMSLGAPTEIYTMHLGRLSDRNGPPPEKAATQLTHFNDEALSQVAMSPLETFWFTGAHGDKVQGFLVKPPNFDASRKYPVKFLIHGGPQGAWGDDWSYRWNPELFASPTSSASSGYVVIMINFHGSTGYGQKFIDAINGDWGGAPFEDLMKGLDYAEQTYPFIDKNRECALGASYGGYMANWILGHTDRFKCIVSHDGMFNAESAWGTTEELWFNDWEFKGTPYDNRAAYEKWSPHQYAKNFKTPTLVIHGQRDYRLDVSEGFQLFTTLQMEGVPSKMLYFPDEGHWVLKPQNSKLWYETVNAWVDQWTK